MSNDPADDSTDSASDRDDGTATSDGTATNDDTATSDDAFSDELDRARDLLDGEGIEAVHVGVVRDGEIDTTFAQRDGDGPESEGLRALALLSAHVRLVANEAGVDASTVAGDAATLAGQVERIPGSTDDLPEE